MKSDRDETRIEARDREPGDERAPDAPAMRRLEQCLHQAAATLDAETELLRAGGAADLTEYSDRKARHLMELSRTATAVQHVPHGSTTAKAHKEFRRALDANALALHGHLSAIREIVELITDDIRAGASDGTYERSIVARPQK